MEGALHQLLRGEGEEVWDRHLVEPQARRANEHEPIQQLRRERGDLGREHSPERMSDDVRLLEPQLVEEVEIVDGEVENVVEVLHTLSGAESGMGWGVHSEAFGQVAEEPRTRHRARSTVQEDERWTFSCSFDDGRKLAAADGNRNAFHAHACVAASGLAGSDARSGSQSGFGYQ